MSCLLTSSLGAYLLGALDPAERADFEAHLGGCEHCRSELVRLAPLPGLLHNLRVEDFEAVPGMPMSGLPYDLLVAEFDHDPGPDSGVKFGRRAGDWALLMESMSASAVEPSTTESTRPEPADPHPALTQIQRGGEVPTAEPAPTAHPRRGRRWLVAAAVVSVLVGAGGVLGYQELNRVPEQVPVTWSATDPATGIRAEADLIDRAWGTEVRLRLHNVPPDKDCWLVVHAKDGKREIAGWWSSNHPGEDVIPGSTSFDVSRIADLEIVTENKVVLVDIPAP